jgi:magnesium chelatase subunit I
MDRVRLIELPLNAGIDEVVGGVEERAVLSERTGIRRGILAQADRHLLYVDEVNLLPDQIVDAILDAAAQGHYSVRRGPVSATYSSRLVLVGSMNPEEGRLRPQILDRFGLRLFIRGLDDPDDRLEVYRRVQAYLENPRKAVAYYAAETEVVREEIQNARDLLPDVELPEAVARQGIQLIDRLKIDSLRAEITLFESARAYAAAAGRAQAVPEDIRAVAPMALRLRRSKFMDRFFADQETEEAELVSVVDETFI